MWKSATNNTERHLSTRQVVYYTAGMRQSQNITRHSLRAKKRTSDSTVPQPTAVRAKIWVALNLVIVMVWVRGPSGSLSCNKRVATQKR